MHRCRPFLLGAVFALAVLPLRAQTWSSSPAGIPAQGFATAIALAGDELLVDRTGGFAVGTGDILVYRRDARGGWTSSGSFAGTGLTIGDGFGAVLAADGGWLAVGAPSATAGGKVHLFQRVGRRWSGVTTLASLDTTAGIQFGSSLAFQNGVLLVGAPGRDSLRGEVYAFRRDARGRMAGRVTIARGDSLQDRLGFAVALALAMSGRQLQRKLQDEGITFQALLDRVRRDVSLVQLRVPGITAAEVALALGYSEASAFSRAFRRWTGLAPGAYAAGEEPREMAGEAG